MESTKEKNRLIAEFDANIHWKEDFDRTGLSYHNSWGTLKPVFKKLYDLFLDKSMPSDFLPDYHKDTDNAWKPWAERLSWICSASGQFDISKAHESAYSLIQWYNTQKS